ncbi:MAG: tetratricopeptide repeat protein [Gammaproteobacteria bacterium]|nr:tetratricopeptide repeat protein [Gammaproteobacteria bacterium]MDH4315847.1 tetratricopeptide repeat protein [Gammaproteobacteria bacterium]MDH5214783.1 tetratricopeptide repeat protein [Gammaproteobacteria bacterium]
MLPNALETLQRAAQSFSRGDLVAAENACRKLLSADPAAVDALHLLALVRKQQGDFDEAEKLMRDCLRREPRRADIWANLGNLYSNASRYEEAETAYRRSFALDTTFRPARLGLARMLLKSGQLLPAVTEAQVLLDANRGDADALTVIGTARRELGQYTEAESALRDAIAINPRNGVARHNLGSLLAHLSRSEEALEELEAAAACGIRGPDISFNIASALFALNRLEDADRLLTSTVTQLPRDARAHRLLCKLRFMRGNSDYTSELGSAVRRFPQDTELRLTLSQVLRGGGLLDEALEALQQAPEPAEPRLQAEVAAGYQEAGRFDDACDAAGLAVAAQPDNAAFTDVLMDALLSAGRFKESMQLIEKARRRQPLNQWYIALEATAARALGDPRYEWLYDYDRLVQVFELEPPPGWSSIEEFHAELLPVLRHRHRFENHPLDQSLRNGTQTPRSLLGDPDPLIKAFIRALDRPISEYRARIGHDASHPLLSRNSGRTHLTGCWSVQLKTGGYHVNHVHPEGWISSAYYVEVPGEVADTAARTGWIKFGEPRFAVPGTIAAKYEQPAAGRLILFPSYLWHGTVPLAGSSPRMTIAFDAVPRIAAGDRR